jgi:hypothetical protein
MWRETIDKFTKSHSRDFEKAFTAGFSSFDLASMDIPSCRKKNKLALVWL